MTEERRARPTIRCLTDDLGIDLPDLGVDLGDLDHPFLDELRRIAPTSPDGQKRILSIAHPLVYRIRVSSERGATWADDGHSIVWLCAVHRREQDSDDDAFAYFASLHVSDALLPTDDDRLRDRAEAAIRLHRQLSADLRLLLDAALATKGTEQRADLGGWLPSRTLVISSEGVEEIWCALSVRATDGSFVPEALRDLLFVEVERHLGAELVEPRSDWPTGPIDWFEAVVLCVR